METTIVVYWGYIGIMENKMETTIVGYISRFGGSRLEAVSSWDSWFRGPCSWFCYASCIPSQKVRRSLLMQQKEMAREFLYLGMF